MYLAEKVNIAAYGIVWDRQNLLVLFLSVGAKLVKWKWSCSWSRFMAN